MKYTESTKHALSSQNVIAVFEEAKAAKTKSERARAQVKLGDAINRERAHYLKNKGWSCGAIAEELNVSESFVRNHLVTI